MMDRVILVPEDILIEDMLDIRIHLGKATKVLSKLHQGTDKRDYAHALRKLDAIIEILNCLNQKKFNDVSSKVNLLNAKYKIDEIKEKIREYEEKSDTQEQKIAE
ncbi:hypothetical protein [Clostridium sp. FP1]|uniref:hypothetical protein n=1 Tax=Clostridium sp. FP1 TaxID=2724076 RepID=UPI0013E9476F|nr:hypothetical protein [Clostridium sp. FP1]MBZ9635535.1 hypothetical protein [Clostridium sp. FP1]